MSQHSGQDQHDDYDVQHYAVESASSVAARRRRRKALTTLAVLVLGLFFAFWWAYSYYKASDPRVAQAKPSASATCQPVDPQALTPPQVTVNVLNATKRQGLAASAGKEFTAQGYVVAKVGNDTAQRAIAGPAEVRFGPSGKAAADLVMASLGPGAVAVPDARPDASVDVALGEAYTALSPLPSPTSTLPACPASTSPSAAAPS